MRDFTYSIPYNLGLMTLGCALTGFAVKSVALPHGLVSGGFSGLGLLLYYLFGGLTPGLWYLVLNLPVFALAWLGVSRRFFFYSLFGMAMVALFVDLISYRAPVHDPWLAVLAAGTLFGAGLGLALRTLGSTGGLDIIGVALNMRWNIRIGQVSFAFNLLLLLCCMFFLTVDRALYSLAMVFVSAMVMEYFLRVFNRSKLVLVISDQSEAIGAAVLEKLKRGVTYLSGRGGWTGESKSVLLTVVYDIQLKRLEQIIYGIDPEAFTIVENTFNVLGYRFARRKVY